MADDGKAVRWSYNKDLSKIGTTETLDADDARIAVEEGRAVYADDKSFTLETNPESVAPVVATAPAAPKVGRGSVSSSDSA